MEPTDGSIASWITDLVSLLAEVFNRIAGGIETGIHAVKTEVANLSWDFKCCFGVLCFLIVLHAVLTRPK